MAEHTPGPWGVVEPYPTGFVGERMRRIMAGTRPIARLSVYDTERTQADGRLIAAAPDMLEALENLENDAGQMPPSAWDLVQNAIRKAKGEA